MTDAERIADLGRQVESLKEAGSDNSASAAMSDENTPGTLTAE